MEDCKRMFTAQDKDDMGKQVTMKSQNMKCKTILQGIHEAWG